MRANLPDYPWESVAPLRALASEHPDGLIDLSIGSPIDPTPDSIRDALAGATDAHGYPLTVGSPALREAISKWFARRRQVPGVAPDQVLPTVGSKELVAWLPFFLGLGPGDVVVHPRAAYPTYAIGAALAGATACAAESPAEWPSGTKLVWVNSPGNPDGRVLSCEELAEIVAAARSIGAVVASDECYAELGWGEEWSEFGTPSVLDPRVVGSDHSGVLAVYSLSKQSNLAGYRAAFVAGDTALIARLSTVRKHAGMIVPAPVQSAMVAALNDDTHVAEQKERYRARRDLLQPALVSAGFRIDRSEAGLYVWATDGTPAMVTMRKLAELGILAGPGIFYGDFFPNHVRFSLTATDAAIKDACRRLSLR